MVNLPELKFSIVAIKPDDGPLLWKIKPPPNVVAVVEVPLSSNPASPRKYPPVQIMRIGNLLLAFLTGGKSSTLTTLLRELSQLDPAPAVGDILSNPQMFSLFQAHYEKSFGKTSFHHYFWALRVLIGGLLSMLLTPFPQARVYHTVSTGFAGLLAARASFQTGRPAFVTEHGIYLLERQIEVMMADWIGDQTESGLALDRADYDLRDLWIKAFQSYTKACYNACDPIVSLYTANSLSQKRLGASGPRLRVIPNGIDPGRFANRRDERDPARPLVALIGRVVPIKDIKTYIRAAAQVHASVPDARFVVMGPEDEDKDYAADCRALVAELKLQGIFQFAGLVDIADWMPKIDLLVLTSLSEAQPLVILEGGVCGIPVVAPDVGSCRDLIEGTGKPGDDQPGGIVTALVDPDDTARAITSLLRDPGLRDSMGEALRERIVRDYDRNSVIAQYRELYNELGALPEQVAVNA